MCGIAGIFYDEPGAILDESLLRRMTAVIEHRGPDGEGVLVGRGVGLGHRRLAIIDPAAGHQPMIDDLTGNVIVYNGEIYNYVEIRAELEAAGHRFKTRSDTEVILKAYAQWGVACLDRFNGMWAFALWDGGQERLFLARDRLGIKPLHYCRHGRQLLFASEMKSLFAAGVPRVPDREWLDVYLTLGYVPAPHSYFTGISKLAPGHCIIAERGRIEVRRYWELPLVDERAMRTDGAKVDQEFESTFRDSVRISMRSDVPFGAFLSGGLDSASIVSLMGQETSLPVETFTIGFEDPAFDERELARLVATQAGTNHHEAVVAPEDLHDAVRRVAFFYDEPFGDSSALPTGHVARLAASRVKMVLTGDGGDEVLSGYRAYKAEKLAGACLRIAPVLGELAAEALGMTAGVLRGGPRYAVNRYRRALETTTLPFEERLLAKAAWLAAGRRAALLGAQRVHRVEDVLADLMKPCPYHDPFYRLMYFNHKISLPDDMLTKVDRMSMAWSIEARLPFLDFRLVELMATVHKDVKMPGLVRKAVLRRTVAKTLPAPLLAASKRGFVVPLSTWFRQRGFADGLVRDAVARLGLCGPVAEEILVEQRDGKHDHGNLLWMLLVLDAVSA